jgi:hypothetical protein
LGERLLIYGSIGSEARTFTFGIGRAAQAAHSFRNGNQASEVCVPAADQRAHSAIPTKNPSNSTGSAA